MSKYLTAPVPTKSLPGGIPYIIGNEAAERFSFYGMKGILVVFMTTYLWVMSGDPNAAAMPDAEARAWYHLFTGSVYLTPFIGAIIADAFLGKYLTIMLLSIVYCIGHGMLALMGASFGDSELSANLFLFLGLSIIAIGSGGIKPCVSAHVGDQFGESNGFWLSKVFGWFYVSINMGAFISNLLTPWLLKWYGPHWAFGVPGVLMAIATVLFWMGRHKFIHVPPGGLKFLREIFSLEGLKAIGKLAIIYAFVAVFWALFDQTGSSWVLQAENMNREWLGFTWLESQIQAINPIMILIYVPLFGFVIYPIVDKVFSLTPIRKIAIGLFLMVPGFAIVSMLQDWIDAGQTPSIGWQVLAYAILTASEVMVSITCLEFSYTQAPRKMKSLIMAAFLASVTLGNYFTMGVNWYIQIDAFQPEVVQLESSDKIVRTDEPDGGYTMRMPWVGFVGDDGVVVRYDKEGNQLSIDGKGVAEVKRGASMIEAAWRSADDVLPSPERGQEIVSTVTDPWGKPLSYALRSGSQAVVTSAGPDGLLLSADDIHDSITIIPVETPDDADTWLSRRIAERRLKFGQEPEGASGSSADGPTFREAISIGGGNTLEGSAYFWFFTWLMLGTAFCFIPVAYLYRPKEYLQQEAAADGGGSAAEANSDRQ
ncbi:MAG: POT family MFS transporter [Phycisphaerales bacterium]|nr:POT family MFS transporter [Phycisphaerales bacterium]